MASKYLLMIYNNRDVRTKLCEKGFLYPGQAEEEWMRAPYDIGTMKLTIADHTFEYSRCHKKDSRDKICLYEVAYVSTNIFSEETNVSCLKSVLGEDIQFTLYKDVTTQKAMPVGYILS